MIETFCDFEIPENAIECFHITNWNKIVFHKWDSMTFSSDSQSMDDDYWLIDFAII